MNSPTAAASTVNVEELKLFHTIDREMFCKLTFSLHHDPLIAIRIMSFWLWLESSRICCKFVSYLHSLPFGILKSIALETITCLHCLDDASPFSVSVNMIIGIPVLVHIVNNDAFSLPYIINNRDTVLESMQRISDNVCARVFDDILSQLLSQRQQYQARGSTFHSVSPSTPPTNVPTAVSRVQDRMIRGDDSAGAYDFRMPVVVDPRRNSITSSEQTMSHEQEEEEEEESTPIVDERTVADHANSGLRMSTQHERTVFLTFSKGYPVTETQLRDFFFRRFGEIIEDLIMQDAPREEQPLFARMVVHSSDQVEMVLGGENRVKFTINGKHVYARKYNCHRSPPPSPVAEAASE